MAGLIRIISRPRLRSPVMIAAWPGVADVSMIVATYLKGKLDFKPLAELDGSYFFEPSGVAVKNSVVEAPQFPVNQFYYWKRKGEGEDIILFMGEEQPVRDSYEMAHCILDFAQRYNVKRIYTVAAALSRIHHTEQSRIWGVGTTAMIRGGTGRT